MVKKTKGPPPLVHNKWCLCDKHRATTVKKLGGEKEFFRLCSDIITAWLQASLQGIWDKFK